MSYNVYQKRSLATAIYPRQGQNFPYVALGLAEEVSELLEKHWETPEAIAEIESELGDVLWYLAQACTELDIFMSEVMPAFPAKPLRNHNIIHHSRRMARSAGAVSGVTKKMIRDDRSGAMLPERRDALVESVGNLAVAVFDWARCRGVSIRVAMDKNTKKLESRKQRNALGGNGDHR
jgi:NTP pyrophosphatase (non-canonical NTP hydrolase)